ncbi:hypothetical protein G7Z17_g3737 [Cylindrodendrum hubeiense]|uniref:Uncharacterized protein n=1 Tax=Cylindrodendrum hubeiense TaxID=595255 RepID=A0A9P5HC18_9HYPO|nr:hypothetical protein G7Z17_g3737 [Cylindrodendrum hubeiense]
MPLSSSSSSSRPPSQWLRGQFASVMSSKDRPHPLIVMAWGLQVGALRTWGLDGLGPLVPHGPRLRFAPWLSNEVIHMSMISSPSHAADWEPLGSQAQANWSPKPTGAADPRHAGRPPSAKGT